MSKVRRFVRILFGWAVMLGVSLAVAGCGGETTPSTSKSDASTSKSEPKAAANPSPPSKTKLRGVAEGGDKTARERRAERAKAKSPSGE